MTIAIPDWHRFGRNHVHAADAVRAKLSALASRDTRVLESLWLGTAGCEIDHVIIGPAGVFSVTVHEAPGRDLHIDHYAMTVDGVSVPYLRQAKFEAEQLARVLCDRLDLQVQVRACVVLVTDSHEPQIDFASQPAGVTVLAKGDVPRWFARQPVALGADQVREAYETARRLQTSA